MSDEEPTRSRDFPTKSELERMAVADLHAYIARLEEEIGRVRQMLDSRQGTRAAAEALFRKG
ncbi:MAG: DUF1192 domain-containing protein [Alphaproteobacteria bacterium]